MVKYFVVFVLLFSFAFGDEVQSDDPLTEKIKTLINPKVFKENRAYIKIIFSPELDYFNGSRVDSVKVIQTLKDNGLLNLFFKKPTELNLSFKTNGAPLFFVKIMSDSLRNIGYYRYVTKESILNNSEFTWKISLTSEYATDPLVLQKELNKSGCEIVDIQRISQTNWVYSVDMKEAHLNLNVMEDGYESKLKRSLYSHWIDVSKIKKLRVTSSYRNNWYPYIAYYDSSLHLLKVIKRDEKRRSILLNMNDNTHYMKISDIYTLKNIKDDLTLNPMGSR